MNIMPLLVYRKLRLRKVKSTIVSLLLANWFIKHTKGIVEGVMVKVDNFIFPEDFIVLNMKKDQEIPIILRHSILATKRILVDIQKGKIYFKVSR